MTESLTTGDSLTATYSATVGGSESEELASNFNITAGASVTATASTTDTFTANSGQDIECFYGQSYTETQGTADQYSADGYDGNSPWDDISNKRKTLSLGTCPAPGGE